MSARNLVPGRTVAIIIGLGAVLTVVNLAKGLVDSDGWWHLAAGRYIAAHGVPATDPFTFTWGGKPWTAHEWLSELLMFRIADAAGIAGLVAAWALFPLVTFGALIAVLRSCGVPLRSIVPAGILCGLVFTTYVTLRPQPISWLLVAVLLCVLLTIRPPFGPWLLLLGPAFALWANLHGLYVAGLGVIGIYLVFTLAGRTPMASRRGWVAVGALAALLGTVLTPAGIIGLTYPLRYLEAGDWGLRYIPEWNTPNFHEPAHLLLLLMIAAVGITAFRRVPGWLAVLSFGSLVGSLLAMRVVPIAAVICMPSLAFAIQGSWSGTGEGNPVARVPRRDHATTVRRSALDLALALVVGAAAYLALAPKDLPAFVAAEENRRFPAAQIAVLQRQLPDADVFAEYSWGGYVEYRLHDSGGRSFVDGRNDMFDQRILADYSAIRAADPEWQQKLDHYGATAILLPPDAPLTHGPAQDSGWCVASRDELAVLLLRDCGT